MAELLISGSDATFRVCRQCRGGETIAEAMSRCTDEELIELLPYIRDENHEKVNLLQLKRFLREKAKKDDSILR